MTLTLPQPLQPGTQLDGRYIIGNLINQGGFGAVYRATDTSESNRPCAIKETYDVSPVARRQALMQAGILFTVKSKHLPEIYDAFEANQRFYLVMQLIEGHTLQQRLRATGHPFSEQQVISWLLPIMHVLQELHSRNPAVIHRDIKPANIILTPDNTAVLVDFGLTKLHDPSSNTQTIIKAVSEGFSPIEQYTGNTGPQSDIYSLAATIYCLLTNTIPPLSVNRSIQDTLVAPRQLNPALSPKIERILLKALAVNPDQRYQSMQEFAQALQAPIFTGYADPTVAAASAPYTSPQPISAGLSTPSSSSVSVPPPPPPPSRPTSSTHSTPAYSAPSPPIHPASYVASAPPGYVLVPQSTLASLKPLPSAFGQGCLWGLLQGILAAIIILALKKDVYFFFATTIGFLFYLLAGYMTTRKGGSFTRGGWAGFWSGITSTAMFWLALAIGLLILITQQIQADRLAAQELGTYLPPNELAYAFRSVAPAFLLSSTRTNQSTAAALIIYLVAGATLAILFGLAGGILGQLKHRDSINKQKSP